jgi:UDPglucose 6-dehydrogenase
VPIIQALLKEKARIIAFDPVATDNFRHLFPDISYAKTAKEVLDADAVLIITEWKEFEDLDYRNKTVIDGRRISRARKEAAIYEGVCW